MKIEIREIQQDTKWPKSLEFHYVSSGHYRATVSSRGVGEGILEYEEFPESTEKISTTQLFSSKRPIVYFAFHNEQPVGWMEVWHEQWNNRLRVWELLVDESFRGKGIGRCLIEKAKEVGVELGARMLVLETQSCNAPAVRFYRKVWFDLIGMELANYTNEDVERKEVRLEFGMILR